MAKNKDFKTNEYSVETLLVMIVSLYSLIDSCRETTFGNGDGKYLLNALENTVNRFVNFFSKPSKIGKSKSEIQDILGDASKCSETVEKVIDLFYAMNENDPNQFYEHHQLLGQIEKLYDKWIREI